MVRAFYLDDPSKDISLEEVAKLGVLHFVFDADNYEKEGKLAKVREERGYNYSDQVNSTKIPELDKKLVIFLEEHLHTDEEIRFFLDGSGYFDVRDGRTSEDKWLRIHCHKGDMLILPAGIYHRFAVDDSKFFHVMRLFQGEPVWTPHNRVLKETEKMRAREEYVKKFLSNVSS